MKKEIDYYLRLHFGRKRITPFSTCYVRTYIYVGGKVTQIFTLGGRQKNDQRRTFLFSFWVKVRINFGIRNNFANNTLDLIEGILWFLFNQLRLKAAITNRLLNRLLHVTFPPYNYTNPKPIGKECYVSLRALRRWWCYV